MTKKLSLLFGEEWLEISMTATFWYLVVNQLFFISGPTETTP